MMSGNALKIIAAICMLIDHIGVILLPEVKILRIIGRLAYPIFAYMIAEGCRYTKNPKRYFGQIAVAAAMCQLVYYVYEQSLEMCILVTFSMSVAVIFALQRFKVASALTEKCLRAIELCTAVAAVYVLNIYFSIDYGFWGCMVPVFAFVLPAKKTKANVAMTAVGLVALAVAYGGIQWYSILAVPLLVLYNGQRGRRNMKYFFYIFYPVHLVALELVAVFISLR